MGGGLMQLVAYGAQDIYLTGNPQITFFKVVYRRHTNFSMEAIEQTLDGTQDFNNSVSSTISRNGDLVYRMYVEHFVKLKSGASDGDAEVGVVNDYGSLLLKEVNLEIGGQQIDRHYGHWHAVYYKLTESNPNNKLENIYDKMSGTGVGVNTNDDGGRAPSVDLIKKYKGWTISETALEQTIQGRFFIPLNFWFCRNPGLALPLIALQYHEVKVKIDIEAIDKLAFTAPTNGELAGSGSMTAGAGISEKSFSLWCDYIYLDTDERRRFAQVSHEYLIEQVQYDSVSDTSVTNFNKQLNFNHPVKELIWASAPTDILTNKPAVSGASSTINHQRAPVGPIDGKYLLKLNSQDRFKERDYRYFTRAQIWEHHTGNGGIERGRNGTTADPMVLKSDIIAVYSFALKPEEHQPSGTCNFSRIDNAELIRSDAITSVSQINIYAINYNVLRIMSGMGGLAYSN